VPLHRRHTDGFLIGRTEVTFADWLAYVDDHPEAERARLAPGTPITLAGGLVLSHDSAGWRIILQPVDHPYQAGWGEPLRYEGRTRHAVQDWRKLPVLGISAIESEAYASWLSRTGRVPGSRLCSEVEWERAARGADGRTTPTGRVLEGDDANLDTTYGRDQWGPDEVDLHPASASPYGLLDTAGNAFEWARGERQRTFVVRGGSYGHDRKTADLSNRNESSATVRDATVGLRLCATPR